MAVLVAAAIAGAILGFIGGPVVVLVAWAAVAMLLGFFAKSRSLAISAGLSFGFVVSFVFLVHGYEGSADVLTKTPAFALLAVFGACCGAVLSGTARLLTGRLRHA